MQIYFNPTTINNYNSHNISYKRTICFGNKSRSIQKDLTKLFDKYSKNESEPLFQKVNKIFIEKLAEKLNKNPKSSIKIGVTGESGSGKSTFVDWVKERLTYHNEPSSIIRRDQYMKDYSEKVKEYGNSNAYTITGALEHPDCVDFKRIINDMTELSNGKAVYPKKRFRETGVVLEHDFKNKVEPSQFVIAEGISIFHNPEFKNSLDISIYADTPADIVKQRWFERSASRGKIGTVAEKCFQVAKEQGQKFTVPYKETSDLVINTQNKKNAVFNFIDDLLNIINKNKETKL